MRSPNTWKIFYNFTIKQNCLHSKCLCLLHSNFWSSLLNLSVGLFFLFPCWVHLLFPWQITYKFNPLLEHYYDIYHLCFINLWHFMHRCVIVCTHTVTILEHLLDVQITPTIVIVIHWGQTVQPIIMTSLFQLQKPHFITLPLCDHNYTGPIFNTPLIAKHNQVKKARALWHQIIVSRLLLNEPMHVFQKVLVESFAANVRNAHSYVIYNNYKTLPSYQRVACGFVPAPAK